MIDDLVIIEFLLTAGLFVLAVIAVLVYEGIQRLPVRPVKGFRLYQLDSRRIRMATILGIKPGAVGTFTISDLPPGSALPAGTIPQWATSDTTNSQITPNPDGMGAVIAVPSSATVPSFQLTISATYTDAQGTHSPSSQYTIPVLAPEVTGFDLTQVS